MKEQILKQYTASITMLKSCVEQYDESVWSDDTYDTPACAIAYHVTYCANMYGAPSEKAMIHWDGEDEKKFQFTKTEILDFIAHTEKNLPTYLEEFSANDACWPDWYDLPQLEFHFNNIRHIQHHTAQLIERHRLTRKLKVEWCSLK